MPQDYCNWFCTERGRLPLSIANGSIQKRAEWGVRPGALAIGSIYDRRGVGGKA